MIKVAAVNYINAKPLLYGLYQNKTALNIELNTNFPSAIANDLICDKIDIGLVPVASIPLLNNYNIITDYCIGATQNVASVALFSHVPLHDVETIYLDYQSRTSINLLKILMKFYWKKSVQYLDAPTDFIEKIKDKTAGVIIGDRALISLNKFSYVYDLAEAWIAFTNLPFVFAAWITNKNLDTNFIEKFNKATSFGLSNLDLFIEPHSFPSYDLKTYYTQNISYTFDSKKKEGLNLYIQLLKEINK